MIEEVKKTIEIKGEPEVESKSAKGRALSGLSRKITDKDLKNPAVVRLILDRSDQLENQVVELQEFEKKYYEAAKKVAVLQEHLTSLESSVNSRSLFIALGGLLGGYLPSLWSEDNKGFFAVGLLICILFFWIGFSKNKCLFKE